jgi:hypothetical protein
MLTGDTITDEQIRELQRAHEQAARRRGLLVSYRPGGAVARQNNVRRPTPLGFRSAGSGGTCKGSCTLRNHAQRTRPERLAMRRLHAKCRIREHDYQPMKRGSSNEKCTKCGDVFPCRHECDHWDCIAATGRALNDPMLVDSNHARYAIVCELKALAPMIYGDMRETTDEGKDDAAA